MTDTPSSPHKIRDDIREQARVVGLRDVDLPTLEAVERRRLQLWVLTTVLLILVATGIGLLAGIGDDEPMWLDPVVGKVSVIVLAAAFAAYAIEKELQLRRLTNLLVQEKTLAAALSNRLHELSGLLAAGKAVNSVLSIDDVLDMILSSALELLDGDNGSIMLREGGELVVFRAHGNTGARGARCRLGEGIAGRVAETGEPLLLVGDVAEGADRAEPVSSAMCWPLGHRGELLGVLNFNSAPGRAFTEHDLRSLGLFAEHAASSIGNARLYEATRDHLEEVLELDGLRRELIASVSHDLRTPLDSVLGAARAASQENLDAGRRSELLESITRQTQHLIVRIDELLASADVELEGLPRLYGQVDLTRLTRSVALDFTAAGRDVEVDAPADCDVQGDVDAVRRILENLIDNAHKHGAAPVRVAVHVDGGRAVVSVTDAGPGVAHEDRDRLFERPSHLTDRRPGSGLGLSIVAALARACGGSVWVQDARDGGADFRVSFALAAAGRAVS